MSNLRSHLLRVPLLGSLAFASAWTPIGLRVDLAAVDSAETRLVRLRSFEEPDGASWMLALDPVRLETSVRRQAGWTSDIGGLPRFDSTTWGRLRREEGDKGWKSSGLSHLLAKKRGIVLSVDLCPSYKPLDRVLVKRVWEAFQVEGRPVPVSFAVSGAWIRRHPKELSWLVSQADSGRIDPTWIDHSDKHRYIKGVPDNRNFLLLPGSDVVSEILGAESEMLRHGVVPSAYFRFPGLVDTKPLFRQVLSTGVLPVGSDSWLAKKQPPTPGSIVLVHGNGNEPQGVRDLLRLLERRKDEIRSGAWRLEDISDDLQAEDSTDARVASRHFPRGFVRPDRPPRVSPSGLASRHARQAPGR